MRPGRCRAQAGCVAGVRLAVSCDNSDSVQPTNRGRNSEIVAEAAAFRAIFIMSVQYRWRRKTD